MPRKNSRLLGPAGSRGDCDARDNLRGQKSLGPLKMSLEMAHKVILPPTKNYIPQFLKQWDINSYNPLIKKKTKFSAYIRKFRGVVFAKPV